MGQEGLNSASSSSSYGIGEDYYSIKVNKIFNGIGIESEIWDINVPYKWIDLLYFLKISVLLLKKIPFLKEVRK